LDIFKAQGIVREREKEIRKEQDHRDFYIKPTRVA